MALPDGGGRGRGGRRGRRKLLRCEGELSRVKKGERKTWHATNDGSPGCPWEGWGFAWLNRYLLSLSTYLGDFRLLSSCECATILRDLQPAT